MLRYQQFFPKIPDEYIVPFLSTSQKEVWQGLEKNGSAIFGYVFMGNTIVNNEPLADPEVNKEQKVQPAPPGNLAPSSCSRDSPASDGGATDE